MCDEIAVVKARLEGFVEERLDLQGGTHASELEVAQPQLSMGEQGVAPEFVKGVPRLVSHGAVPEARSLCPRRAGG